MTAVSVQFADALRQTILDRRPMRVVETGTFDGRGSTLAMAKALGTTQGFLDTIEATGWLVEQAKKNLWGYPVEVHWGSSLDLDQLPQLWEIERAVEAHLKLGLYVDRAGGGVQAAAMHYFDEQKTEGELDLLHKLLYSVNPGMVVLDSAGHLGWKEWCVFLGWWRDRKKPSGIIVALDDVNHIKHSQSRFDAEILGFKTLWSTNEKFGSVILET